MGASDVDSSSRGRFDLAWAFDFLGAGGASEQTMCSLRHLSHPFFPALRRQTKTVSLKKFWHRSQPGLTYVIESVAECQRTTSGTHQSIVQVRMEGLENFATIGRTRGRKDLDDRVVVVGGCNRRSWSLGCKLWVERCACPRASD